MAFLSLIQLCGFRPSFMVSDPPLWFYYTSNRSARSCSFFAGVRSFRVVASGAGSV
jgi:hypothetical protein